MCCIEPWGSLGRFDIFQDFHEGRHQDSLIIRAFFHKREGLSIKNIPFHLTIKLWIWKIILIF